MGEAAALRPLASGKPHGEWFGLAGIAVMALPTLLSLGRETWSTEAGAHGPIVLATGIWLFWRCWPEWVGTAQPGNPMLSGPLFLAMLPFYIFVRAYAFLLIEAGALFGAMGALFYGRFGAGVMRRHWFTSSEGHPSDLQSLMRTTYDIF